MEIEENFVLVSGLICESTRARILWQLLDHRAYTATELAIAVNVSPTSASNHLLKLTEANILKVESQGRHRYYSFASPEVAYTVEALANLSTVPRPSKSEKNRKTGGVTYCRTCYDHLAGFVGVQMTDMMVEREYLLKSDTGYCVSAQGWKWLQHFQIGQEHLPTSRRPLARQCLDWSERRPHLAGQLGALLLEWMLQNYWFRRKEFSRELIVTPAGRQGFYERLRISL